ncbi:T9SS type A sorting domain-containing protein [Bacteroidota bacterium]
MKRILQLGIYLFLVASVYSQQTNSIISQADLIKLSQLPELSFSDKYNNKTLKSIPYYKDNSELVYFRPVFFQYGWSCNQSASIGYMFTYEINAKRMRSANLTQNQYPFRFVWNFLNRGDWNQGVSYFDSWEIIKAMGIPNKEIYRSSFEISEEKWDYTQWMSGYSNYYSGMNNRISDLYTIKVGTPEGLQTLKQWMNNHLDNSPNGGVANFQIASTGIETYIVPYDSEGAGQNIITTFGKYVGHAMTFVGYNDSVRFDINNDGEYTNDKDINHDGIVNLRDWEIGAMICVNSWGDTWADQGKSFVMYRLLAEPPDIGGIWNNAVQVIKIRTNYRPDLCMKVGLAHNKRGRIKISAGVSSDLNSNIPEHIIDFPVFNYQGGEYPMRGIGKSNEIEIGIDITPLLSYIDNRQNVKFFLLVDENDPNDRGEGIIKNFSIMDYHGALREMASSQTNIPIENNSQTILSVQGSINFDKMEILTEELPDAVISEPYEYQLSAYNGAPPYKWYMKMDYSISTDVEAFPYISGEELVLNDYPRYYTYVRKDLEFSFPFYGKYYDHVFVTGDGALVFDENLFAWPYIIDGELVLTTQRAIAPYGTDMHIYPGENGLYYEGGNNMAVFYWDAIIEKMESQSEVKLCVRLFPDGKIEFLYGNVNPLGISVNWIAGISDGDRQNYQLFPVNTNSRINHSFKVIFTPEEIFNKLRISEGGVLSGIVDADYKDMDLEFIVKDQNNTFDSKVLNLATNSTGVDDIQKSNNLLISNYPNPFSEKTNIKYFIPTDSFIRMDVFDNSGKHIINLINNYYIKGEYNIVWNADYSSGRKIPKGIYYIRLNAAGREDIKKVIVQ